MRCFFFPFKKRGCALHFLTLYFLKFFFPFCLDYIFAPAKGVSKTLKKNPNTKVTSMLDQIFVELKFPCIFFFFHLLFLVTQDVSYFE